MFFASAGLATAAAGGYARFVRAPKSLQSFQRISWALGSQVSITALHADQGVAEEAVHAAFAELELVESLLSIYRDDSLLSQLNRTGSVKTPHPYLVEVLRAAARMSRRSAGAFDVTVQPLWDLAARANEQGTVPTGSQVAAARESVDWRRVVVQSGHIQLGGRGTAITLNGIAQGFATDKATATLRRHGVRQALIDAGEINALGTKQGGMPWTIGIQHPRQPDAYLSLASLQNRCLATSGDYATTFGNDFQRHHIFDPRSGFSPSMLASVSVAAPTAMEADALSTAVFVMGPERGLRLIHESPGADALLVLKDGRSLSTRHFPRTTS